MHFLTCEHDENASLTFFALLIAFVNIIPYFSGFVSKTILKSLEEYLVGDKKGASAWQGIFL